MEIEASKKGVIASILSINIAFLIGGIIGEQFLYLHIFYSKHIAHWAICLLILIASFLIRYKKSNAGFSDYFLVLITFIFTVSFSINNILKFHEYSHLTYLLSYVLMGFLGIFTASYKQSIYSRASLFVVTLVLFGVLGFSWKYFLWQNNVPHYLLLFTIILLAYSSYCDARKIQASLLLIVLITLAGVHLYIEPIEIFKSQSKYTDRVIFSKRTEHHQIDITTWRNNHWFYYDGKVQFSSVDEVLYSEAMVHPLMMLLEQSKKLLVIGGENGIIVKELLKYNNINQIDLFVQDSSLYELSRSNAAFTQVNLHSLNSKKITQTGTLVKKNKSKTDYYDAIFIDTPDPSNDKWNAFYTQEFYDKCYALLSKNGLMITQAGNPYLNSKAFASIEKTLQSADFKTLAMHNQILTLGEWGWIMASKNMPHETMKTQLIHNKKIDTLKSNWINKEALQMLVSFGKKTNLFKDVEINRMDNRVLIEYYQKGDYEFNSKNSEVDVSSPLSIIAL